MKYSERNKRRKKKSRQSYRYIRIGDRCSSIMCSRSVLRLDVGKNKRHNNKFLPKKKKLANHISSYSMGGYFVFKKNMAALKVNGGYRRWRKVFGPFGATKALSCTSLRGFHSLRFLFLSILFYFILKVK